MLDLLKLAVHFCELVGEWGLGGVAVVKAVVGLIVLVVVSVAICIVINVSHNILLLFLQPLSHFLIRLVKIVDDFLELGDFEIQQHLPFIMGLLILTCVNRLRLVL